MLNDGNRGEARAQLVNELTVRCKRWLQKDNYDPAKAGDALKYFVMQNYKPSDLDLFIIRFPDKLESHSISIRPSIDVDEYRKYQINEVKLTSEIKSIYGDQFLDFVDWRLEGAVRVQRVFGTNEMLLNPPLLLYSQ